MRVEDKTRPIREISKIANDQPITRSQSTTRLPRKLSLRDFASTLETYRTWSRRTTSANFSWTTAMMLNGLLSQSTRSLDAIRHIVSLSSRPRNKQIELCNTLVEKTSFADRSKLTPVSPKSRSPDPESFNRWERKDADEHWAGFCTAGRRLYVRGLPRPITQEEAQKVVASLFKDFKMYVLHPKPPENLLVEHPNSFSH